MTWTGKWELGLYRISLRRNDGAQMTYLQAEQNALQRDSMEGTKDLFSGFTSLGCLETADADG